MNNRPNPDYERILAEQGMPVTEKQIRAEFDEVVADAGMITNTSRMSPFWRLITAIVTAPVMWLKSALVNTVMKNLYLATASGAFVDVFAWAVNLERKGAVGARGVITFTKSDPSVTTVIPAGTQIQTERINGTVYRLTTDADFTIDAGVRSAPIPVTATLAGSGHNLAPGYYRILPVGVGNIEHVVNDDDWLTVPGADVESDDELRDRVRNQFNLPGQYHIDAVYRGVIAQIAGLTTDRIFFQHDAPRGPGTANVFLLLDSGVASQPFIDTVNDYVMAQGHHGHGDDVLCMPLPEFDVQLVVTVYLKNYANFTIQELQALRVNVLDLIRCAFRQNTDYDVKKTWPYSRFSFSTLAGECHQYFPVIESITFSQSDIVSELSIPRLSGVSVVFKNV